MTSDYLIVVNFWQIFKVIDPDKVVDCDKNCYKTSLGFE